MTSKTLFFFFFYNRFSINQVLTKFNRVYGDEGCQISVRAQKVVEINKKKIKSKVYQFLETSDRKSELRMSEKQICWH